MEKLNIKVVLFTLVVVLFPLYLSGQDTLQFKYKLLPNLYKVQFAGNIGFISLGAGYAFLHSNLQTSIFYSYIPKSIGGADINTGSLKCSYVLFNVNIKPKYKISPYLGISLSYSGFTPIETFPHLGIRFYRNSLYPFKGKDVFFEVGTTGLYLNYIVNNRVVNMYNLVNFSMGVSIYNHCKS